MRISLWRARRPRSEQTTMTNPPANAADPSSDGRPKNSKESVSGRPRLRPQSWWLIFLALLMADYLLTRVFFPEPSSITIPYAFFKQQVEAGNVEAVSSVGDSIEGSFKTAVTYPPQKSQASPANAPASGQLRPPASIRFRTQRPTFADEDLGRLNRPFPANRRRSHNRQSTRCRGISRRTPRGAHWLSRSPNDRALFDCAMPCGGDQRFGWLRRLL